MVSAPIKKKTKKMELDLVKLDLAKQNLVESLENLHYVQNVLPDEHDAILKISVGIFILKRHVERLIIEREKQIEKTINE